MHVVRSADRLHLLVHHRPQVSTLPGRPRRSDPDEIVAENARRPLPLDDAGIDGLEPAARRAVAEIWLGRAQSELRVGARFELLRTSFRGAPPELTASLANAAEDERRHSELCAAVAARYAGEPVSVNEVEPEPLVRFGDADEQLSVLLHLVLLSCINESTSTFYLRAAMKGSRYPLARAALRELLADDVEHARIGWAHLASANVTVDERAHVARALPTLLGVSRALWTDVPERREPWFAEHGCAGRDAAGAAFEAAVRTIVLPGMAHVGIGTEHAAAWLARSAR
jgi:hypothetical protein